jgi:DNA-binding MarR family transcriptional regulator
MSTHQARARETSRTCFGLAVRKAARAAGQLFDDALAPAGLRHTQFSLLNALILVGEPSMGELAAIMAMDRTTLTRNLQPLVRAGLVALEPGEDRRTRVVRLTPDGRAAHRKAWPLWRRAQDRVDGLLGATAVTALRRALDRWTDAAHQ